MRAVNLIPADARRGAGGAAGRSGGGAYILLGALALFVALAAAYTITGNSVASKKTQLAQVKRDATAAEARTQGLANYTKFAALRAKRVDTVKQLAASRFDWSHALHEVARVMPDNSWLTSLSGSVSAAGAAGGAASSLRAARPVPAISVTGCTTSQGSVAKMMARMRLIDGVDQVSLQDSTKTDTAGGGAAGAGSAVSGDCRGGHTNFPQFNIVVFFAQQPAVAAAPGTTQTASSVTPVAGAAGTPAASTATPGATGTASPTTSAPSGGSRP
jgi:Tfp pilus assembly protein PilN